MKIRNVEYLKAFGDNLRKLGKSKGFSMTELAILSDIEYRQISDIELGKINATISTVKFIAQSLWIKPKDLLDL